MGFADTLLVICAASIAPSIVLASTILFQWIGFIGSVSLLAAPGIYVIHAREKNAAYQYDDKKWDAGEALERYVQGVKKQRCGE